MFAPNNRIRGFALAVLGLVALVAQPALGLVEVEQNDSYEIALPGYDLQGFSNAAVANARQAAERTLGDRYDSRWSVYSWNPQTGTPAYTYGTAIRLVASVGSASELDNVARGVIAANAGVLRADNANLRLGDTPNALGKWAAHYQQTYQGLDVWQGKVIVVMSEDGKLVLMGSDYYSGIEVDPNPAIDLHFAEILAKADLPFNPATDGLEADGTLLILPRPISETEVSFHLVWRVRVHTESPMGTWVTHVDAHSGEIVWRYNDIHFAYNGDTDSGVEPITYCDGEVRQAMPYLDIDVNNIGTVTSDSDGNWSVASGSGDRAVGCDLYGPYCNITNQGGAEAQYNGLAQEGVPHTVLFDDGNSQQDERDVFDAVNDIHDFFQAVAPEFALPNNRMLANVSIADNCNAFWNGTINFFTEGGGCANTGELQGVVHHEFGHGVQAAILGYQGEEGLGEGNGDIIANYITDEAIIGRGFNLGQCVSGIRNSLNDLIYPDNVVGQEIHFAGQVIAGFHWDALEILQAAFGEETGTLMGATTWHYGRVLTHPTSQPAQVLATFLADDDDNNLGNGTPRYAAYCIGATNHGFNCPEITEGVLMSHLELDDTDDPNGTNVVSAIVTSTEADVDPSTVKVIYRHEGGAWTEMLMTDNVFGDDFTAILPAMPRGHVEYYFYAEDDLGNVGTLPYGAPAGVFDYQIAWIADHAETVGGWSVGDATDTATGGIWVNVDPVGSGAQPEDDHTNYGTNCWVTGQHTAGQPDDFSDVDGGKTTLLSPTWDLSNAESVQISYWYWLTRGVADQFVVKISNDGGAGYLTAGTYLASTEWRNVTLDLADFYGTPGQLKFSFQAFDNGPASIMEVAIDDLVILADFSTNAPGDGFTVGFPAELAQNHPNPFNPVTEIKFSLEQSGPVTLSVFDAQGRLVRELSSGNYAAGEHRVTWNGQDEQGRVVASGVYLYRLEAAGEQLSRRMLLIK